MSKIKFEQNLNKEIPQPIHHSSPKLRVLEKLSTKGNELKVQQGTLIQFHGLNSFNHVYK